MGVLWTRIGRYTFKTESLSDCIANYMQWMERKCLFFIMLSAFNYVVKRIAICAALLPFADYVLCYRGAVLL